MIFAVFPLDQALGAVVAHTHRLGDRVIRKGSILDEAAIDSLRDAGRTGIIAAKLEHDDLAEDESATRIAAVLNAAGLTAGRAATGRVNIHAECAGLLSVDRATVDAINLIDPSVTVATLADASVVAPRDMVATIKIIPFAVPEAVLDRVEQTAHALPSAFSLHPFRQLKVGLALSELPGLKPSVIQGTIDATRARVAALSGILLEPIQCPHREHDIAAAIHLLLARGAELVLIAGASATVDTRDVGPAAVVSAGGEIVHFGMPVDPGNLICVGRIGPVSALVLPGCARSPKLNGIDLVMRRLFAGLPVNGPEIMRMGVGGLLKDTDTRPLPRAKSERPDSSADRRTDRPKIAAIVLAAGQSTRMAPHNKLLIEDATGKPLVVRVVENALSSHARPVVVSLGHAADRVRAAISPRPVQFVVAEHYVDGMAASLKAAIGAIPVDISAAVICLGDMPLVTARIIDRLLDAYDRDKGRTIIVPTNGGKRGNPILWDQKYFPEMLGLTGDTGARALLLLHADEVFEIDVDDDAVLRDFDTLESLDSLPPKLRPNLKADAYCRI